jgi:hypothetical protein
METFSPHHVAWFITPHGFGHAARSAAVMLALEKLTPVHFDIYTRVPEWFFRESNLSHFTYHDCLTDIGLVQKTSLDEDLGATLQRLDDFYPLRGEIVAGLAAEIRTNGCRLVVSDIAPLGLAVAQSAGLPSVLVENFTWDWIYTGYSPVEPDFNKYIKILAYLSQQATEHIQTEPVCAPDPACFTSLPVSRPILSAREVIRQRLSIPVDAKALLLTMGGIQTSYDFLSKLEDIPATYFIIPGGSAEPIQRRNLRLLPHHSGFYHPDLVAASDAVVGKLGYSTLAEAYTAGVPFGFVPRARFRESGPLTSYVLQRMNGMEISEQDFADQSWLRRLPELFARPVQPLTGPIGAEQVARRLRNYLV